MDGAINDLITQHEIAWFDRVTERTTGTGRHDMRTPHRLEGEHVCPIGDGGRVESMARPMAKEQGDLDVPEPSSGDAIAGGTEGSRSGVVFDRGRVELLEQSGAESGPADDRDASEVVLRPGHDQ